jgi:hypothetical protein
VTETFKKLAQGYLQATPTAIYAPSGVTGIVRGFLLLNQDTAAHEPLLYQDGTNAAHQIAGPGSIPAGLTADNDDLMVVNSGGTLYGATDQADVVSYILYGLEVA